MTTMVERVARVLCIKAGELPDTPTPHNPNADFVWQFYRDSARAAIEAMRMHTKEMDSAGYDAYPTSAVRTGVDHLDIYRAMIDAALSE